MIWSPSRAGFWMNCWTMHEHGCRNVILEGIAILIVAGLISATHATFLLVVLWLME